MFQLAGVVGYLFRPLAEAVVFALVGSFLLSRTLVPTLANYLLGVPHLAHGADGSARPLASSRNPLKRFQLGCEHRFEQIRDGYHRLLSAALGRPKLVAAGFLARAAASFVLGPFLQQKFFP